MNKSTATHESIWNAEARVFVFDWLNFGFRGFFVLEKYPMSNKNRENCDIVVINCNAFPYDLIDTTAHCF